jgi:cell division protein FtsI/penicillin-binding protein 2
MADPFDPDAWRQTTRVRLIVVGAVFALWSVTVLARLVDLQVRQHQSLSEEARRQQMRTIKVPARRGEILDRNGHVLAYSVDADSVIAEPTPLKDPEQVAAKICEALGDCGPGEQSILAARFGRPAGFMYVRRFISGEQARRVADVQKTLKIAGLGLIKEPKRFYPNRELAAHLLGYVGIDDKGLANKGLAGLEAAFDRQVRGRPGQAVVQLDSRQHVFNRVGDPPLPGATLELTIDEYLQYVAERELRAGVEENRAAGGSVVIMDPNSGEILAMANEPTFNPNTFGSVPDDQRRNRAVQDVYEPGSTFKIVTVSAALDENIMSPDDMVDTGNGSIALGSRVVKDTHAHGLISLTDVVALSSNVGAIKVGFRLGTDRLGRYVERFGFGTRLSPDFRGENAGIVWRPTDWTETALMSVSMGYQIGVTPLQMACAASAVANGGELVQPRLLRAVIEGNTRTLVPHKVIRRVMSRETAAEMTSMLEAVVERGTATVTKLPDYTVAGKTGTSNKLENGRYSPVDFNASFVGFVPSRRPAVTIIVVLDSPHGASHFGGVVSAPIFKRIADAALRYLAVTPTIDPLPPVLVTGPEATREIKVAGPALPLTILPGPGPSSGGQVVVPELRGLNGREALRVLARLGIGARVTGDGVVTEQDPLPGVALEPGAWCHLALGRAVPGLRP